ncbi:kinase-like domain-containing protein [Aspergillus flavus]|uniref:Kinase-like domain-containing protein n=1 Tax=Aspergillus flavus (strain ATCC 200026 / FGSC A1120 / IAM 13836 / NRRL 3357 / JCM 12722 / SRRC 167) TaxID=332952 RepID=A0A7U2MVC6_ASPFN|nr:kinase-like domain-containing protein [Aspergillus flavus]
MDSDRSEKHLTRFPHSMGQYFDLVHDMTILSPQPPKETPGRLHKDPRKRPSEADTHVRAEKRRSTYICQRGSPWDVYRKFATLTQSNNIFLAVGPLHAPGHVDIVLIRLDNAPADGNIQSQARPSHPNLVNIKDVFLHAETLYTVYEDSDVSLERFISCTIIEEKHIATICKEVLEGLKYIHEELQISYQGSLYENICLTTSGRVKIANIGASIVSNARKETQSNLHSVGQILRYLVQPGTSLQNPTVETLMYPSHWSPSLIDFLDSTKSSPSAADLLSHPFLGQTMRPVDLAPLVWMAAQRARLKENRDYGIIEYDKV